MYAFKEGMINQCYFFMKSLLLYQQSHLSFFCDYLFTLININFLDMYTVTLVRFTYGLNINLCYCFFEIFELFSLFVLNYKLISEKIKN